MFGRRSGGENTTVIGRGAKFVGTLELEGSVIVEGHCEGTITTQGQLSVGPKGNIVGEVSGATLSVAGRVQGTIVASDTLHLLSTGMVEGEVFYGRLQVDPGGVMDGRSHQGARPALGSQAVPLLSADSAAVDEESGIIQTVSKATSAFPSMAPARVSNAPGKR